jgi:long-chain fatty acid transport protein
VFGEGSFLVKRTVLAWAGLAVLGVGVTRAETARASPLFELLGSSVGTGGFNARAHGASSASTYFNPAMLPRAREGVELGWFVLNDAISVTLDGRSHAADIPETALRDIGGRSVPPLPTIWLERGCAPEAGAPVGCDTALVAQPRQSAGSSGNTRAYQVIGLVNHVWDRYLSYGLYTLVPLGTYVRANSFFNDEREQYFSNSLHPELYADRLTAMALSFGVGSQPLDWLSLGVSFTLSLANAAAATAYVGNANDIADTLQLSTKLNVTAGVSPHFSAVIEPFEQLHLSVTAHSPQMMGIETASTTYLPSGDRQLATREAVHAWLPWIAGLGASYDLYRGEDHAWALTGTATYQLWSKYRNRQGERAVREYEWSDIPTVAFGVRHTYQGVLATFLDGVFHPSPVPAQTGRTNYVDNDRIGVAAGLAYDWHIAELGGAMLRFAGQMQMHFLPERYQRKIDPALPGAAGRQLVIDERPDDVVDNRGMPVPDAAGLQTNNPGWPGFSSRGMLAGGGVSVSLLW